MPAAIDTLNIYSRLKSTGLPEKSPKEIAEVFQEIVNHARESIRQKSFENGRK